MAYGFDCKHCGHGESPHLQPSLLGEEEASSKKKGYRFSLEKCPEFTYAKKDYPVLIAEARADPSDVLLPQEVEDEIARLNDADGTTDYLRSAYEAQGRSRAAFGRYANHCYRERLERDIGKLDDAVRGAHTSEQKKLAEQAKEKYMRDAQNAGRIYIG